MLGQRGNLIVLSAPSGTGKSTMVRRLMREVEGLRFSVSATTREPRPGESDGIDYRFLDDSTFTELVEQGGFLEHACVHGNRYGTLRSQTQSQLEAGQQVLLDIDVQGARQVVASRFPATLVFVLPPSRDELERRLRGRGSETEKTIARRLEAASRELEAVDLFDHVILNDDLDRAVHQAASVVRSLRSSRAAMEKVIERVRASFRDLGGPRREGA